MFTNYSTKVVLRDYADRNGLQAIELRVILNREVKRLGLQIKVSPAQFADGKVVRHDMASEYNMIIARELAKVNDIMVRARLSETPLTIETFTKQYDNPMRRALVVPCITTIAEELRPSLVPASYKSYLQTLEKLRSYAPLLTFNELCPTWLQQWELWLMTNGLSTNTISKHHKVFKMLLGQCVQRNIIYKHPYADYSYARVKGNRQALTGQDVMRLKKLFASNILPSHQQETLRAFLFSCGTGLRLSDVVQVKHSDISGGSLVLIPQKTKRFKTKVSIPLGPNVMGLISTTSGRLFNCATYGQHLNRNLRDIKAEAKIAAPVTMHVGRHTFATLYLESGGKPEVLMKLMGITKWETVQIYIHIVEERKREALEPMDAWFK